jgi:RHS repeat-associated protein
LTTANLSHRYLWNPAAVDALLADEQLSPLPPGEGQGVGGFDLAQPGNVVLPLADNLGTVRDLAVYNAQTAITAVVNHRVFDSYGNLKSQTNAAVDCLFGFTGFSFDKASGTYRSQTRPYDPSVGRWQQPDWDVFTGHDTNLDRYCGNSPTNGLDNTGQAWYFLWIDNLWNWCISPAPPATSPPAMTPVPVTPDAPSAAHEALARDLWNNAVKAAKGSKMQAAIDLNKKLEQAKVQGNKEAIDLLVTALTLPGVP